MFSRKTGRRTTALSLLLVSAVVIALLSYSHVRETVAQTPSVTSTPTPPASPQPQPSGTPNPNLPAPPANRPYAPPPHAGTAPTARTSNGHCTAGPVPGEILVTFAHGTSAAQRNAAHAAAATTVAVDLSAIDVAAVHVAPSQSVAAAIAAYRARPDVVSANQSPQVCVPTFTPNDPSFSQETWAHQIWMPQAWDTTEVSHTIGSPIIADVDTGFDTANLDFRYDTPWSPPFNGTPKFTLPHNYITGGTDVSGCPGHGTVVIRAMAEVGNNATTATGVGWRQAIMPLKVWSDDCNTSSYAYYEQAIMHAADSGAEIINVELAGAADPSLYNAIQYAVNKGRIVVAPAGNIGENDGPTVVADAHNCPACYSGDLGVIAVAAVDETDTRASFSDYGTPVSIAAPGADVLTTSPGGGTTSSSGTSLSAPQVAAVAALVYDIQPWVGCTPQTSGCSRAMQQYLQKYSDPIDYYTDPAYPISGMRLNAAAAVTGNVDPNRSPYVLTAQVYVERWISSSNESCANPQGGWCVRTYQLGTAKSYQGGNGTYYRMELEHNDGTYAMESPWIYVVPNQTTQISPISPCCNTNSTEAVFFDRFVKQVAEPCAYPYDSTQCWQGFQHEAPLPSGAWYEFKVIHPNGTIEYPNGFMFVSPS